MIRRKRRLLFVGILFPIIALLVLGCGSDGGGDAPSAEAPPPARPPSPPLPPLPPVATVAVSGTVDDTPIPGSVCVFENIDGVVVAGPVTADAQGNYTLLVPPNQPGFVRCSPPGLPNLVLSAFVSTVGLEGGQVITEENVTPATTVMAVNSEEAIDQGALDPDDVAEVKASLETQLAAGTNPTLTAAVNAATADFNMKLDNRIDRAPVVADVPLPSPLAPGQAAAIQLIQYKDRPDRPFPGGVHLLARLVGGILVPNPSGVPAVGDLTGLLEITFTRPMPPRDANRDGVPDFLLNPNVALSITEDGPDGIITIVRGQPFEVANFFDAVISGAVLRLRIKPQDQTPRDLARNNATGQVGQQVFTYFVTLDVGQGVLDARGRPLDPNANDVTVQFTTAIGAGCSRQPSTGCTRR